MIPCSRTCNQRGSCINHDNGNDNLTHGSGNDNDNNHGNDNDNIHGNDNDNNHGNHAYNNRGSDKDTDNDNSSDNDNGNKGRRQKFRTSMLYYVSMVMEKQQEMFQNQGGPQKISGPLGTCTPALPSRRP